MRCNALIGGILTAILNWVHEYSDIEAVNWYGVIYLLCSTSHKSFS